MSYWPVSQSVWFAIALACGVVVLVAVIKGLVRRIRALEPSRYQVKLKVGSRTLLFDPDEPSEQFEARLTEALEEPSGNAPAAR